MSDHVSWPRAKVKSWSREKTLQALFKLQSSNHWHSAYTCLKLLRQDSKGIESSVAPRPYSTGGHRAALDVLLFSAVSLSPRCSKPTRDRTSILFQQYLHNSYQLKSCSFQSTLIYVDAWRHAVKPWHLPQKSTRFPMGRCHCHFSA